MHQRLKKDFLHGTGNMIGLVGLEKKIQGAAVPCRRDIHVLNQYLNFRLPSFSGCWANANIIGIKSRYFRANIKDS